MSAVAEGAGVSLIMYERSRSLRIPGAVYRRFAPPEPTMGIALAWRRGGSSRARPPARDRRGRGAGYAATASTRDSTSVFFSEGTITPERSRFSIEACRASLI